MKNNQANPLSQKTTLYKTAYQLSVVAKEPFTLHDAAGTYEFTPPKHLRLMPSFFREYQCLPNCAGCCPYFTLELLPSEASEFHEAYPDYTLLTKTFKIGEKVCNLIVVDAGKQHIGKRDFCGALETEKGKEVPFGGCRIYHHRPYSCHIEPIKIHTVKDTGYIHKRPFGRGWAMQRITSEHGALCEFEEAPTTTISPTAYEQGRSNDLPVLYRMLRWADLFGIDTYLERIINQVMKKLEAGDPSPVDFK